MRVLLAMGIGGLAAFALGCPSPEPCAPYKSSANLASPAVAFRADVAPVFSQSCTFSSCHGVSAAGSLALLDASGNVTPMGIVGVVAAEYPALKYVEPGDPAASYLMHKMDGDSCGLPGCDGGLCAVSMPQAQGLVSESTRDTVRRWIAQGALGN